MTDDPLDLVRWRGSRALGPLSQRGAVDCHLTGAGKAGAQERSAMAVMPRHSLLVVCASAEVLPFLSVLNGVMGREISPDNP